VRSCRLHVELIAALSPRRFRSPEFHLSGLYSWSLIIIILVSVSSHRQCLVAWFLSFSPHVRSTVLPRFSTWLDYMAQLFVWTNTFPRARWCDMHMHIPYTLIRDSLYDYLSEVLTYLPWWPLPYLPPLIDSLTHSGIGMGDGTGVRVILFSSIDPSSEEWVNSIESICSVSTPHFTCMQFNWSIREIKNRNG